ncbi:MAG TPA: metal ABC transporter ATP-binding protein [Stackebrandtia sp.]|uniref:metal ABC transporter ATP-binding protein n=1 Tax=Stackebrandtia sp. TaxID=2023065 RepID=UPI002D5F1D69|nr:metal ABC transporter ATP-binding protein [Stackebrandtia sp.]HZE41364.1 metal ABC transporter ATP-binding protein [Stackebrandtia sp.]
MNVVEVSDAVSGYEARRVLRGVDLTVRAGQAVALLGPNGSGKSTLVKTVLGLVPLSSGDARLFGTPVRSFRQWRRVGYVPQRLGAGGGVPATVSEVVSAGRLSRRRIPMPATRADRLAVAESLDAVGLSDRSRDAVSTLSGGQQQRVLIARALATEPDLMVLDEPTAGVDAANAEILTDVLHRRRARGTAILLVVHEPGPLRDLIDTAVMLSDGAVTYSGPAPTDGSEPGCHVADPTQPSGLWSVA